MSENIIIAFIAFLGGIATTYLGWALNQKRIKKFKKGVKLPKPEKFASYEKEYVIWISDDGDVSFDFGPNAFSSKPPKYVSMVYKFPHSMNVRKFKTLTFDLLFGEGIFNKVWLELHSEEGEKRDIWREEINRDKEHHTSTIDLKTIELEDICRALKEICFVVDGSSFPHEAYNNGQLKGSFKIRNLKFK